MTTLSDIVSKELSTGEIIYYSCVEKGSERGLSSNKRLFVMVENKFICYLSDPQLKTQLSMQYLNKQAKVIVPLKQVTKIVSKKEDKKMVMNFYLMENGKKVNKSWNLKMETQALIEDWQDLFEQFSNRSRIASTRDKKLSEVEISNKTNRSKKRTVYRNDNMNEQQKLSATVRLEQKKLKKNASVGELKQTNQSPESIYQAQSAKLITQHEHTYKNANKKYEDEAALKLKQQYQKMERQRQQLVNQSLAKINQRSKYFQNVSGISQQSKEITHEFKNYYRPYQNRREMNKKQKLAHMKDVNTKYGKFIEYSKTQAEKTINDTIYKMPQNKYNSKSRIVYEGIHDITIQIYLSELKTVNASNNICDETLLKQIQNRQKNLDFLYSIISSDQQLSSVFFIPMSCIVEYKGHMCCVTSKINPEEQNSYSKVVNSNVEISKHFQRLAQLSKVDFLIFENENNIKFIPKNAGKTEFIIVHAKEYLPALQDQLNLRKQSFKQIYHQNTNLVYHHKGNRRQMQMQDKLITFHFQTKLKKISELLDKLEMYPIHPSEFGVILHSFGINIRYLSLIHNKVNQIWIKSIIKTEAAIRSVKMIYRKKIQEECRQIKSNEQEANVIRNLLNIIIGNTQQSALLWKVIAIHSQLHFNLAFQLNQLDKGYFIMGLSHHLRLQIFPKYDSIDKIFEVPNFVDGVRFNSYAKSPLLLSKFYTKLEQTLEVNPDCEQLVDQIINEFELEDRDLPPYIKDRPFLHSKILYLFSNYISPNDVKYTHLEIYGNRNLLTQEKRKGSLEGMYFYLQRKIIEIKWEIKSCICPPQHINELFNRLKLTILSQFGRYHPFLSQILELQANYNLSNNQGQKAIQINRQSLTNMILCCGSDNKHIKISNNYYQMGECFVKCKRIDQAINSYKKAKNILEINHYQQRIEYALVLHKLGLMYLNQFKDSQSYQMFVGATKILQSEDNLSQYWGELVPLYECISRSLHQGRSKIEKRIELSDHCIHVLQKIIKLQEKEGEICSMRDFKRILRIVTEDHLKQMQKIGKECFREYVFQVLNGYVLVLDRTTDEELKAFEQTRKQIKNGDFYERMLRYIDHSYELLNKMKNEKKLISISSYRKSEILAEYDTFMRNLIYLLGEGFIINAIQ